jgi:hypothetical protein
MMDDGTVPVQYWLDFLPLRGMEASDERRFIYYFSSELIKDNYVLGNGLGDK